MTIVVHAAGNDKIGVGHLSRTRSLVAAFIAADQNVSVIYEGNEQLVAHYRLPCASYHIVADRTQALASRAELVRNSTDFKPVLITDLLDLNKAAAKLAREQGFNTLVHLNDSGIPDYCPDIWVNGDAFAEVDKRLDHNVLQLLGAPYHIVQAAVLNNRRTKPWHKAVVKRVLVTMGGSDPEGMTERFAAITQQLECCEFTLVLGPAFSEQRKRQLLMQASAQLSFVTDIFDLSTLMLTHDLVITLGGISSYEAMCLGIPVAAITWKYLAPYVLGLDNLGLLHSLGDIDQAGTRLERLIQGSGEILAARAAKAWQLIDGQGAARVVAAVLSSRGV